MYNDQASTTATRSIHPICQMVYHLITHIIFHENINRGFSIAENVKLSYDYVSLYLLQNCGVANIFSSATMFYKIHTIVLKRKATQ